MWTRVTRLLNSDWGLYLTRGGVVGTNFFSMLVIAFLMKADEFGYYALMWASAMSLSSVVSVGVPSLLLRELSAYQVDGYCGISRGHALRLILVWPAVLLVAVVGLAAAAGPAILPVFGKPVPALGPTLLAAAAALAINILNVIAVVYRILGHAGMAMALRDAGPQALMLVATILVAFRGRPEAQTSFAAFLILAFVTVSMVLVLTRQRLKEQFTRLPKDHAAGRHVIVTGFWGTAVANMVWTQVDILLGGLVLAPAALGHYQVLKRIANLAAMPQIIANWSAVVQIGRAFAAGDNGRIQAECRKTLGLAVFPLLGLLAGTILAMPLIIRVFDLPPTSGTWIVMIFLLAGSATNVLFGLNFLVASQCHLEHHALGTRIVGLVVTALLIAGFGAKGNIPVAIAYFAGMLAANVALWAVVRNRLGVDTSVAAIIRKTGQV